MVRFWYTAMVWGAVGVGGASGDTFSVEMAGHCNAMLAGRIGGPLPFRIHFEGDTAERQSLGLGFWCIEGEARFAVDGLGAGDLTDPMWVYVDQNNQVAGLSLVSGERLLEVRSPLFQRWTMMSGVGPVWTATPVSTGFRELPTSAGQLTLTAIDLTFTAEVGVCYADCDVSKTLDIFDFLCFQDSFMTHGRYGDCTGEGIYDILDFVCFQDAFVTGCS